MTYLAACLRFKNELPYLQEWIEFHRIVGVEKFYLYNHKSTDAFEAVLEPYIQSDLVVLHDWQEKYAHPSAAMHCIEHYKSDARWIAFIDADEFLVPIKNESVTDILQDFEEHPALAVHWRMFGSDGHQKRPEGLVTESYFRCADQAHPLHGHVKSIVNPRLVTGSKNTHLFTYANDDSAVNEIGHPVTHASKNQPSAERICLFHYFCKSREEGVAKTEKGQLDDFPQRTMQQWEWHDTECNVLEDRTMKRFLPELRQRIAAQRSGVSAHSHPRSFSQHFHML